MTDISRGSAGTNNSASSGHDNSSLSARHSSTSTLPSSTDTPLDDRHSPHPIDTHNIPLPAIPGSSPRAFRAGGRAFSFGRKKGQTTSTISSPPPPPPPKTTGSTEYAHVTRERALTESSYASGSTATPPKLQDTGLDLGLSDLDGFGSMFDNVGKPKSHTEDDKMAGKIRATESPENLSPGGPRTLTKSYFGERTMHTPSPIHIDRSREIGSSPYTSSHHSQEGLMASRSPPATDLSFDRDEDTQTSRYRGPTHTQTMPLSSADHPSNRIRQPRPALDTGLRRTSAYAARRDSVPLQDEDARLVMDSINASKRLNNRRSGTYDSYIDSYRDSYHYEDGGFESQPLRSPARSPGHLDAPSSKNNFGRSTHPGNQTPIEVSGHQRNNGPNSRWRTGSAENTPRAKKVNMVDFDEERPLFDTSLLPSAPSAPHARKNLPQPPHLNGQNKVMTPAQFEQYRKEQESQRRDSAASESEGSDAESDDYDDEDEAERSRELAKQRRKQEAHLAVYRQQMMKVTGEQPSELPNLRPDLQKAQSTPASIGRSATPTFSFDKPPGSKTSDDEDDEVPLGILAAHGFPAKNRPPTVGTSNPTIQYKSESYPPPPMSSAGASPAGRQSGLPPFAKNLPPDPYFGAGLVNPSTRESLGMGNAGPGSSYGGSQPGVHPAGLVGIIVGEERAKAARRGSPNAQNNWSQPLPQGMGMPAPITPGDEAQIQMSHQMTHMMQMQMQWMQQMQQMMAGGMQPPMMPGQQPGLPPFTPQNMQQGMPMGANGFLSPQAPPHLRLPPNQIPRPMSHSAPGSPAAVQNQQRAMSMVNPSLAPAWQTRKSVAPSMMSGALSHHQGPHSFAPSLAPSERSNVGMPSRYRPVSIAPIEEGSRSGSSMGTSTIGGERRNGVQTSTAKTVQKAASDDDDDQGWEEMKAKREQKKSGWRFKKERKDEVGLQGIYFDGQ